MSAPRGETRAAAAALLLGVLLLLSGGADAASQCYWAGSFCDLSAAFVLSNFPKLMGPNGTSALTSPAKALLVAAATDAACGLQETADECAADSDNNNCMWFDAETSPSCISYAAIDREMAATVTCPGSVVEVQRRCTPMVTEANCIGVVGGVCTWDKRSESCQAKAMVKLNNDTKAAAEFEKLYAARDPSIFGNCSEVKFLFALQDACPIGANSSTCPTEGAVRTCAFDGTSCIHTRSYLMSMAGVEDGHPAFKIAQECMNATTRNACGAVGTPVGVSTAAIDAIKAGKFEGAADLIAKAPPPGAKAGAGAVAAPAAATAAASGAVPGGAALAAAAVLAAALLAA
ncbi:MAG: hypothetical protein J3K34DRAFT_442416 [Monoraphidium minutum]|nr:MAG: hypothetical protein J3K34DRAFT_442416 [Monoraphidium minutum]